MKRLSIIALAVSIFAVAVSLSGCLSVKDETVGASRVNDFTASRVYPSSVTTIATSATQILAESSSRTYAVITNPGATTTYLGFNSTTSPQNLSTAYFPIMLTTGQSYIIDLDNLYTGKVIATATTPVTLRVLEVK
jgi:hypothetical protein